MTHRKVSTEKEYPSKVVDGNRILVPRPLREQFRVDSIPLEKQELERIGIHAGDYVLVRVTSEGEWKIRKVHKVRTLPVPNGDSGGFDLMDFRLQGENLIVRRIAIDDRIRQELDRSSKN